MSSYMVNEAAHNVLTYSIFETVNDIINANMSSVQNRGGGSFINEDGDIYIPLNMPSDPNQEAIPRFLKRGDSLTGSNIEFSDFRGRFLSDNITTLKFNKSISLAVLLEQLASDKTIYGCLLKSGSFIINPLHPMLSFMIVAGLITLPEEGELHIFPYSQEGMNKVPNSDSNAMRDYKKEYEKFFALAPNIILDEQQIRHEPIIDESQLEMISARPLWSELRKVNVRVRRTITSTGDNPGGILVPLQIAADGILTPYYGVAAIDDPTSSVRGYNLSPMRTGNINRGASRMLERQSGNVCTGDENSSRKSGWLTLSRVNLNSMFYGTIVNTSETFEFVESSKQICKEIWSAVAAKERAELQEAIGETVTVEEQAELQEAIGETVPETTSETNPETGVEEVA